jgi:hypothetical protein
MTRRRRGIYLRAAPGPQPSPSHLSLLDSRENNSSSCGPALSLEILCKRLTSTQRINPTQPIVFGNPCGYRDVLKYYHSWGLIGSPYRSGPPRRSEPGHSPRRQILPESAWIGGIAGVRRPRGRGQAGEIKGSTRAGRALPRKRLVSLLSRELWCEGASSGSLPLAHVRARAARTDPADLRRTDGCHFRARLSAARPGNTEVPRRAREVLGSGEEFRRRRGVHCWMVPSAVWVGETHGVGSRSRTGTGRRPQPLAGPGHREARQHRQDRSTLGRGRNGPSGL